MVAVGKLQMGSNFSGSHHIAHSPKNIQEGSAEISCEDIDILSHHRRGGGVEMKMYNEQMMNR